MLESIEEEVGLSVDQIDRKTWLLVENLKSVAEPPNRMPLKSTCLPLDAKYSREDTKLHSSVEHTPRKNSKIHIFPSGS